MIALSQRRPLSINIFAVAFFAASLATFVDGLSDLAGQLASLQKLLPAFDWSRDAVIVWRSAWLSIALIPIAMVWLSAVRFARWMVTFMAVPKVLPAVSVALQGYAALLLADPMFLAALLLGLLAVAMLFTPASNRWFAGLEETDPAVFE